VILEKIMFLPLLGSKPLFLGRPAPSLAVPSTLPRFKVKKIVANFRKYLEQQGSWENVVGLVIVLWAGWSGVRLPSGKSVVSSSMGSDDCFAGVS
jgi:hypothetical protein